MKKKIAIMLSAVLILGVLAVNINADKKAYAKTAELFMELPDEIRKEEEFSVIINLDSDVDLYSINAYLSYDPEMIEFVSKDEKVSGAEGLLEIKDSFDKETKKAAYEVTFKALKVGETDLSLNDIYLIDYADMDCIETVSSAKSFEIAVNENENSNAKLSDLIVAPGELTEKFSSGKKNYEMYVDEDVENVGISAIPADENCVVDLDMPEKIQIGENVIKIIVTAPSGDVNTYILKVYRGRKKV